MKSLIELFNSIPKSVKVLTVVCVLAFEVLPMFKDDIGTGMAVAETIENHNQRINNELGE